MLVRSDEVTELLKAWSQGDSEALSSLMEAAHAELLGIARGLFRRERVGHTLQPTAIVNEVYFKLRRQRIVSWHGRAEFFGVAARYMRRVLVDHARQRGSLKRGGAAPHIAFDESLEQLSDGVPKVPVLDGALADLKRRSPRQSRIVEFRVLVGLTLEEIALLEGISRSTVAREWRTARLFMLSQVR